MLAHYGIGIFGLLFCYSAILLFCPMYILIILNYILVFIVDKLKKEPTPEEIQRAYDKLEEQLKDSEKE